MHKYCLVSAALILAASAHPALADSDSVETVVVSATRTPQPAEKTGESISVISAQQLEDQQTVALTDALEETPGLTVNRTGPIGQVTSVSLRGAETGQTLVLIDGVRINDPSATDEGAILGDLLANNTARIEVLRGPQSTLYGSDAIGGVIDIVTKRGGDSPFAVNATGEGGSFDTWHLNVAANGTADTVDYGAAANFYHTNAVSAADARNGNPETDGYTNFGATENVRWHIAGDVSLDLRSYYTKAREDFDDNSGFTPPFPVSDSAAYNTNALLTGYAGLNFTLFDGLLQNRISATATQSDREFFDSFFDFGAHQKDADDRGHTVEFEYQGIVDFTPDDELTFGAESQRLTFTSASFSSFGNSFDRGGTTIGSGYAQYQKTLFDTVTLTGGVRYDRNSQFGSRTSLKIAGAWQVLPGTTLRANYGDGFKAPSLFEQFSEFRSPFGPLSPETARGWEAGADQLLFGDALKLSLTWFERDTHNLIDFQSCFVAAPPAGCNFAATAAAGGFYFNIGRTTARGLEAEAKVALGEALSADFNLTDMITKDTTPGDPLVGLELTRRPHLQESTSVNWTPLTDWSLGASVIHVGRRVDQYDASVTPPAVFVDKAYTTANLYSEYHVTPNFSVYGRIENVFDTHYEPELGFGAEGRAYFAGIRVTY